MTFIKRLHAQEVLDSRGRPTVKAWCETNQNHIGSASVPSGASTGAAEALELRDGDATRYGGLGCRQAVAHINDELNAALSEKSFEDQASLDQAILELDDTPNKSRLGANALLATSLAFARASALDQGIKLYEYFSRMNSESLQRLPRPTINLFSGGLHAGGQVPIQDVLIIAASAQDIDEALATTYAVYQSAAALMKEKYNVRALSADEGGLAPPCESAEEMLTDAVQAIENAGFKPGEDVVLAVDVASTHFFKNGAYHMDDAVLDSAAMIEKLIGWSKQFPIVSIEDGLSEDDWSNWPTLRKMIKGESLILGDDLLCTNPQRIKRAIKEEAADALLLKVNQIGTITEACEAGRLARTAGWQVTVSARSGETEDHWLADLAVGWGGDQIKIGSITQSERLAKYNRLLEIETETGWPVNPWPGK